MSELSDLLTQEGLEKGTPVRIEEPTYVSLMYQAQSLGNIRFRRQEVDYKLPRGYGGIEYKN